MYKVFFECHVESYQVAEFESLNDAKKYCKEYTRGWKKILPNDHTTKFNKYSVYDGDPIIIDEDGDPIEVKDPVFTTAMYYDMR